MTYCRFHVASSYLMLRFVLVIFRAFPKNAGGYTRHGRDTEQRFKLRLPPIQRLYWVVR
jgi:hypothetical protein